MKMHAGVYDINPETASEFPHGPVIVLADGKSIYFDLYMEQEALICLKALSEKLGEEIVSADFVG